MPVVNGSIKGAGRHPFIMTDQYFHTGIALILVSGFLYIGAYGRDTLGAWELAAVTRIDSDMPGLPDSLKDRPASVMGREVAEKDKVMIANSTKMARSATDGAMKNGDPAGSVISVKPQAGAKSIGPNVLTALGGRAAGVEIRQSSGNPGTAIKVFIRGASGFQYRDPLYIVDGMVLKSIDFLNPDDIESIAVLKDVAAMPNYRPLDGVVIITTKSATEAKGVVAYDAYMGIQRPWRKPSLTNAEQWAILKNEATRAVNLPVYPEFENPSVLGEGTDWFDEVTRNTALVQSQYVSVARGTERLKYLLSAGFFHQGGTIEGSGFRKITFRINAENKLSDWLSLGSKIGLGRSSMDYVDGTDGRNGLLISALSMDPVTAPRDSAGNLRPSKYNNIKNPLGILEHADFQAEKTALTGTLHSTIDMFRNFKFITTFGLDMALNDSSESLPEYYISPSDNRGGAVDIRRNGKDHAMVFENTLAYRANIFSDHSLKLLAGTNVQDSRWESNLAENFTNSGNDPSLGLVAAAGVKSDRAFSGGDFLTSFFGKMEYGFAGKYFLTCAFRRDGSSRFAPEQRWGNFPSLAGAWKMSQEPFMKGLTFIEGLKLRAGWGKTGSQFQDMATARDYGAYQLGNGNTQDRVLPNSGYGLFWDEQAAENAGLDMSLFGGKIGFFADFFRNTTTGVFVQPALPIPGLQAAPWPSSWELENEGVEFFLDYGESAGDFRWKAGLNFATYDNKVISLGGSGGPISGGAFENRGHVTRTEVGRPIGCFYGYRTDGLFQNWDEVNAHTYIDRDGSTKPVQPGAAPGDIRYRDENHDGILDKGYLGSPHPDFSTGLSADVAYKGFDLNALVQGVYGNEIFNGTRWYTDNGTAFFNLDKRMLDRWTGPGTTNDVNLPRMNNKDANNMLISDRFIEDGSTIRLKALQLGYTMSKTRAGKVRLKRCRLYAGVENLLTLTRYSGLEPEIGLRDPKQGRLNNMLAIGVDYGSYPQPQTYFVGLQIGL